MHHVYVNILSDLYIYRCRFHTNSTFTLCVLHSGWSFKIKCKLCNKFLKSNKTFGPLTIDNALTGKINDEMIKALAAHLNIIQAKLDNSRTISVFAA